jgi:hypothetical protein
MKKYLLAVASRILEKAMRWPMPSRNPGATGEIIFASAPVIVLRLNFDFYEL